MLVWEETLYFLHLCKVVGCGKYENLNQIKFNISSEI